MKSFNKLARYSLCLFPLLLSGCGAALNPYHENFNCQAPDDSGKCVDTPSAYAEAVGINQLVKEGKANTERDVDGARLERLAELLEEPQTPMIVPPRILRVLILPYKGDGDLFMARYAYLQVESAQWLLSDIDEDIESK
ncbi:MAG: TraV family lipoprotein [Proteobacteria bacterium]|nr:TraV family lipoprotein [Pseudomonadota bacterium]